MARESAIPSVPVVLDRPRSLRFDLNALVEAEDAGVEIRSMRMETLRLRDLRILLWAGLLHEDASLTTQDVGAMIGPANMAYVGEQIGKAISGAMPEAEENAETEGEPAPPLAGSTSGLSGSTT